MAGDNEPRSFLALEEIRAVLTDADVLGPDGRLPALPTPGDKRLDEDRIAAFAEKAEAGFHALVREVSFRLMAPEHPRWKEIQERDRQNENLCRAAEGRPPRGRGRPRRSPARPAPEALFIASVASAVALDLGLGLRLTASGVPRFGTRVDHDGEPAGPHVRVLEELRRAIMAKLDGGTTCAQQGRDVTGQVRDAIASITPAAIRARLRRLGSRPSSGSR